MSLDDVKQRVLKPSGKGETSGGGAEVADVAALLDSVRTYIDRFCVFPSEHASVAVTLWAVHTHMAEHFYSSPRLALLSPEPGSGKTRVLEVLNPLVAAPMLAVGASAPSIFRTLAVEMRTLLFDEVDAIFTKRGKDDANEELRALLNVGYKRGAAIPRCVGPRHEVVMFPGFAPAALAGLGDLPDTLMSRSIIIRMRKRAPSEHVEPFRARVHEPQAEKLREPLAAWGAEVGDEVGAAWPDLPDGIVDRPAELWEPLLAVADAAGGHWPQTARAACVELAKVGQNRVVSLGVRLLEDLRHIFGDAETMSTQQILEKLNEMEEAPWGDLYGKPLQSRTLARMLKRYDVSSVAIKDGVKTLRGYRREPLWDAWERYLPASTSGEAQPPQPEHEDGDDPAPPRSSEVAQEPSVTRDHPQPTQPTGGADVADTPTEVQPSARVRDGTSAEVADVALLRNPTGARDESLVAPAQQAVAILRQEPVDQLRTWAAQHLEGAPVWWEHTARTEPLAVAAALRLLQSHPADPTQALNAARAAVKGDAS